MSMNAVTEKLIADYIAAYRDANGDTPVVRYDNGWFTITLRGWIVCKKRRADMVNMLGSLRLRIAKREASA